jgi:hypothetical protein
MRKFVVTSILSLALLAGLAGCKSSRSASAQVVPGDAGAGADAGVPGDDAGAAGADAATPSADAGTAADAASTSSDAGPAD